MLQNNHHSYSLQRIKALIVKEFFQIIKDSSSFLIAVVFPLMLLFLYAVGVSLDMDNLKVGMVLEDTSSDAQSFYLSLKNSKYFSVDISRSQKDLEHKLIDGKIRGMVILPFYFSKYKDAFEKTFGEKAPIYVVADGSEPNTANFVQNYVQGAWINWQVQQSISHGVKTFPGVAASPRFWYNEELNSRHFLLPGSLAIIMTLVGALLTALVVAREWERGTMESLMTTPVTMREIYISKLFCYFFVGMITMLVCTFFATSVFGIPFRGSLFALTLLSSTFLLGALGTGLLISIKLHNQFLASQIALLTGFLPAYMLSGFVFEISSMPSIIQWVSSLLPARYMVSGLLTIFLVGDVWKLILINILAMGIVAAVLFLIIFGKTKKRLD